MRRSCVARRLTRWDGLSSISSDAIPHPHDHYYGSPEKQVWSRTCVCECECDCQMCKLCACNECEKEPCAGCEERNRRFEASIVGGPNSPERIAAVEAVDLDCKDCAENQPRCGCEPCSEDRLYDDGMLETALGWKLEYDEVEKSEVVTGLDGIKPRGTWNATEFQVMHDAARSKFKSKLGKETFQRMLSVACYKNRFHRIRDHLGGLPTWDGVKRIDRIMTDAWGMHYDDHNIREIHSMYLHHFFVGAVRKVATPERKHHQVLTLTGERGGEGKSTFAEIVGYDDIGLYADIGFPPDSKTVIEWTRGSWIVELSELAGYQRQNWDVINHVISTNRDVARLAYDRNTTSQNREFIFIATTNTLGFIRGIAGIRRWNVVDVSGRTLNKRWLRDNRSSIWAEAKHYAEDPEWQSFVDRDDQDVFAKMNAYADSFVQVIPEVAIVEAAIQGLGDTLQLAELRKLPQLADIKPSLITASLKRIGYQSRHVRLSDGKQVRAWVKV